MMHVKLSERTKKNFFLLLQALFFLSFHSHSQWKTDTIYFDKNWKNSSREDAVYFRLMDVDTSKILFLVKDYYMSGKLQMEGAYRSINPDVQIGKFTYWYDNDQKHIQCFFNEGMLDGIYREWHKNGNLKTEKNFINGILDGLEQDWDENNILVKTTEYKEGVRHGNFITYYPNGQPIRKDLYVNGELKKGNCYTHNGKDTSYFDYFIMPRFKGGLEGFKNYILEKLNYPEIAKQNEEEGLVHIRFTVDTEGNIKGIRLIREDKEYFNKEAIKVITDSPKWNPGKRDGKEIDVSITIPIIFKLR